MSASPTTAELADLEDDGLLWVHAECAAWERRSAHPSGERSWACLYPEQVPEDERVVHAQCRECVLAAGALAANHEPGPLTAYGVAPKLVIDYFYPAAFYNAQAKRHGLPLLLAIDDHVYGWGWT